MARITTLWLACHAISLLSLADAWKLTWRNETGAEIESGDSEQNCTRIYHEEGEYFSFVPEGLWCLDFWSEDTCQTRVGLTCDGNTWTKASSRDLAAFNVYSMPIHSQKVFGLIPPDATTSSSTSTTSMQTIQTMTVTRPAEASATTTSEAASGSESDSGDDSSLSGGAIAGIVIGAVAGIAAFAALCFFWGKRKTDDTPPAEPTPETSSSPPPPPMTRTDTNSSYANPYGAATQPSAFPLDGKSAAMSDTSASHSTYPSAPPYSPAAVSPYPQPEGPRVVELHGNHIQLSEMDGSNDIKRSLR